MMMMLTKLPMHLLKVLDNKYVSGMMKVFLILYASLVAPKLPKGMLKLFKNSLFKVFVLFMIVYLGIKDPVISILIAVGFTVSMVTLHKLEAVDSIGGLLDTVVDAPQEVANDLVDSAQEIVGDVAKVVKQYAGPLEPVLDTAEDLVHGTVDMGQDVANMVVDSVQDTVGMFTRKAPEPVEEELSGYSGNSSGSPL